MEEGSLLLSDLPDDIVHHVFSYVVVQLSMFSKQLLRVLQRRSTLVFDFEEIPSSRLYNEEPDAKYIRRHKEELNYIVSTLDRYHRENIHLESFNIYPHTWFGHPIYNRCINLAAKKSLRKLDICIINENDDNVNYILPKAIFQVKSLVELYLMDCFLKPKKRVVWSNLKKLKIYGCKTSEKGFEYITQGCPSIEKLGIDCRRFSNSIFNLANLRTLKKLKIMLNTNQRLEMNASTLPNLEYIDCSKGHIDLGSAEYPNLTNSKLFKCGGMNDHFFNNFASKFPKLENLRLHSCQIKRIHLSSPSLKEIELVCTRTLQEMCFSLPNLVSFTYVAMYDNFPELSFASNSSGWSSHITLCLNKSGIDSHWFLELNKFLVVLNRSETSINVQIQPNKEDVFNDEEHLTITNPVIPVQGVKEFSMVFLKYWTRFRSAIFECIFLICQHEAIRFQYIQDYDIPELLYKKLIPTSGRPNHLGVVDFEMSYVIDHETSQRSVGFKERDKFLEVSKDANDISFHLKYKLH